MTAKVVKFEHGVVGHQVGVVEEQSVETYSRREFEVVGGVPLVLCIEAEFVECHSCSRTRLAIVAIGETYDFRSGTVDEVVNTVVTIVASTVSHILVVGHLVFIAYATHEFVVAEIEGHVILHVPHCVVYGVVICKQLIAKSYVVVSVARTIKNVDEGEFGRVSSTHVVEFRESSEELV